jgi:hypothetical protein
MIGPYENHDGEWVVTGMRPNASGLGRVAFKYVIIAKHETVRYSADAQAEAERRWATDERNPA